jgi:ATP-binding cassette subfamily G (WHITE) protein 2 (SNQ2)
LSSEQRKRVTIAVEVVAKPAILFADEATTGLDTKSALRVVKLLKRVAKTGVAVCATIHQPVRIAVLHNRFHPINADIASRQSAETFAKFDDVLLLQRGGKQVYFGPRKGAVEYFLPPATADNPNPTSTHANPADFLLDITKTGVDVPDEELDTVSDLDRLSNKWTASSQYQTIKRELARLGCPSSPTDTGLVSPGPEGAKKQRPRPPPAASILRQCILLTKRVSKHYFRDPSFSYTKLFTSTVVPLVVGLSFFLVGRERSIVSMQNRLMSVFLLLFVPVVWLNVIIFKVHALRALWEARERPSRIYGKTAFITSLLVSEVPYSVACASAYFVLWYFLSAFLSLPFFSPLFFADLLSFPQQSDSL